MKKPYWPEIKIPSFSPSKKTDDSNKGTKPPNIIICADSAVANDNVRDVLESVLKENKYEKLS